MTVAILPAGDAEASVWGTALEVSGLLAGIPWVLVGAQMVMLLEREAGRPSGRTTGDVDAVIDVRALADGTGEAARRLVAAGFETADPRHPYRFSRGDAVVDLLAPDHLGPRADITTIPPATTARPLAVDVVGGGSGVLPVPSLAGAIALKTRAWQARQAARDAEDMVRLLALVRDVEAVRAELRPVERRALGRVRPLADPANRAWRVSSDPEEAQAAFARLAG